MRYSGRLAQQDRLAFILLFLDGKGLEGIHETAGRKGACYRMKTGKCKKIILPYKAGIPLNPRVSVDDKITEAVRRMIACDVHCIAVIRKKRPIGLIRLEDALEEIGLEL